MTEHDPEAADDLPAERVENGAMDGSPSSPAVTETASVPSYAVPRVAKRRFTLSALGMLTLLMALLIGSVFVAPHLIGSASLAPETSLFTTIASGQQANSQTPGSPGSVMQVICGKCAPKHSAYTSPPIQPVGAGQVVIVSLSKQQLWAYQNGQFVMTSLVTTGMPQLPTPTGTFHIMMKEADVWFYSPWPYGSPYYYSPEHINYAMLFRAGGFYIHDAPWRETFGPGTNVPHTEPDGKWATGSHGCVNMPTSTAAQLYRWIGVGATVIIRY